MLKRIHIAGYKSLRNVRLENLSRSVVLFGANAAGKSNFLDALDLLGHLAREDTLAAAFRRHRGHRLERPLPMHWFFHEPDGSSAESEMLFEVDLDLHPPIVEQLNRELQQREQQLDLGQPCPRVTSSRLRYRLVLQYSKENRSLHVTHESLIPLREDGSPHETIEPFLGPDGSGHLSVRLERQSVPRLYDLPRPRTLLSEISDTVDHPHLVAVARELRSLRVYYVEPDRMRSSVNDIEASEPGPHGEQLASFYYGLRRTHGVLFRNLIHNLSRIVPTIENLDIRENTEGFLDLWVAEKGHAEFPAALVSEGTLRLLCILGIAASPAPPAVVGYEEPENGVNPARLGEMLSILENAASAEAGSQFILTTHSPAVIDFFSSAVRILCEQVPGGSAFSQLDELPARVQDVESRLGRVNPSSTPIGARFARGDFG